MNVIRNVVLCAACFVSGAVFAQSAPQALNLKLPPQGAIPPPPMPASSAAAPATAHAAPPPGVPATAVSTASAPGVYYGDTSGRPIGRVASAPACNDATYNQPQTHGSVSMGVMGGNHVSGNYQAGTVNITKNLGTCEHPTGSVGISISVGQSRFGGHRW